MAGCLLKESRTEYSYSSSQTEAPRRAGGDKRGLFQLDQTQWKSQCLVLPSAARQYEVSLVLRRENK
jgi:hypothetical protein